MTPEVIDTLLADFRTWLCRAVETDTTAAGVAALEESLDLHTLVGQFTALRQEVNLQTRAVRSQQEQNVETLQQYGEALEKLSAAQAAARAADAQVLDELLRPWLKNLLDAHDALTLAQRQVERTLDTVLPALEALSLPAVPLGELPPEPPAENGTAPAATRGGLLRRLLGGSSAEAGPDDSAAWRHRAGQLSTWGEALKTELVKVRQVYQEQETRRDQAAAAAKQIEQLFDAVLTGYTMSLQRLERALLQCELEPIPSLGELFDPELMEVVEVATGLDRPANEVVEEVRRGYRWRGRVFRYALVRVAR